MQKYKVYVTIICIGTLTILNYLPELKIDMYYAQLIKYVLM